MQTVNFNQVQIATGEFIRVNILPHMEGMSKGLVAMAPIYIKRSASTFLQDEKKMNMLKSAGVLLDDGTFDVDALEEYAIAFIDGAEKYTYTLNFMGEHQFTFKKPDVEQFIQILRSV